MPKIGKKRCGCDCKNQTVETDLVVTPPSGLFCCAEYPDGVPSRYAVLFECTHDWPLYALCDVDCQAEHPLGCPVGLFPKLPDNCSDPACEFPDNLAMTYPALELRRDCQFEIGTCSYSQRAYQRNLGACPGVESYFDSLLIDRNNPSARGRLFPPYSTIGTDGAIEYVKANYERESAYPGVGSPLHPYSGNTLWQLNLSSSPVTLEWVFDSVLSLMNGGLGKPRPRYEAQTTWDLGGRNTVELTNPEDWPTLPNRICIVALDEPKILNLCADHASQCICGDSGFTSGTFIVTISGCSRFAGTWEITVTRYNDGTGLPCGVSYPSPAPCDAFFGSISTGSGTATVCTPGTGSDAISYTGTLGLLIWCKGTGTPASPDYGVKLFCQDADTGCYVDETDAVVTTTGTCSGPILSFTIPDGLPCCCPEDCNCPTVLAALTSVTAEADCGGSLTLTAPGYTQIGILCGMPITLSLSCNGTGFRINVTYEPGNPSNGEPDGFYDGTVIGCDPLEVVFSNVDLGDGTLRTITILQ